MRLRASASSSDCAERCMGCAPAKVKGKISASANSKYLFFIQARPCFPEMQEQPGTASFSPPEKPYGPKCLCELYSKPVKENNTPAKLNAPDASAKLMTRDNILSTGDFTWRKTS